MLPNGVSAGTANPVVPEPVNEALRAGATVRMLVNALSRPGTALADEPP